MEWVWRRKKEKERDGRVGLKKKKKKRGRENKPVKLWRRKKDKKKSWCGTVDLIETSQENGSHKFGFFTTLPL